MYAVVRVDDLGGAGWPWCIKPEAVIYILFKYQELESAPLYVFFRLTRQRVGTPIALYGRIAGQLNRPPAPLIRSTFMQKVK